VFAEVKARASDAFGVPALAVGFDKQRRLRRAAAAWLASVEEYLDIRFDVVAVLGVEITVIEGAF
jgi:putative endonuclease